MSGIITSPLIGLELVQREAFYVLFNELNDAIDQIAEAMNASDQEFAARTGRDYTEIEINHIETNNFHEGSKPSLIDSPLENYPNCSVWATDAGPTSESPLLDHMNSYQNTLMVEIMVKASPSEGEEIVSKRCIRTAEAVNFCFINNATLNGYVSGFSAPSLQMSEIFVKKAKKGYGEDWFWQAARLDFEILKESANPTNSSVNLHYPGIDQS